MNGWLELLGVPGGSAYVSHLCFLEQSGSVVSRVSFGLC